MLEPLLNVTDDEWITLVGKYILNMGSVEATTRTLISIVERSDRSPVMNSDLPSRIGFLRTRFPRAPVERHSWAMKVFGVASKHVGFRNIIAHSPIVISRHEDGSYRTHGILNLTPADPAKLVELVELEELRGRVDESMVVGRDLLSMQGDFSSNRPVSG